MARTLGEVLRESHPAQKLGSFSPLQFYPHSGPLRGSTRLTLCGSNFYLRPNEVPEGTHQITVGQSPCRLLPKHSPSYRYNLVPAFPIPDESDQAAPRL